MCDMGNSRQTGAILLGFADRKAGQERVGCNFFAYFGKGRNVHEFYLAEGRFSCFVLKKTGGEL